MVDVAAQDDFVAGFLAGQGRVCSLSAHRLSLALPLAVRGLTRCSLCVWLHQAQQDAALSAARRELPTPARSWGVVEVQSYLLRVGLPDVAAAFETEQVNGELLLELAQQGGLGHAFAEAIRPDRGQKLEGGALTMGRELALRRAVESLGGEAAAAPLPRRGSDSSEASLSGGGGVQSVVTRAAWRFIAASPRARSRHRAEAAAMGPGLPRSARTRKGNLTDAQVKGRKRSATGFAATFIAIEAAIVLTGSDSPWIHLVSMLPGMMMTLAGVTAFFQT